MKKYLIAGLITLLPIALTFAVVNWLFHFFSGPFLGITRSIVVAFEGRTGMDTQGHGELLLFISRVLAVIVLVALTFVLGFFGRKLFFKTLMHTTSGIFLRIPFVKSVYRISKEITGAVFSQETKTFKKTILLPFPHSEAHTIAFLTGDAPPACRSAVKEVEMSVFVPTSPHPLSGFMLLTPKKSLLEVDVSVEEAFKFLLSCGASHPGEVKNENS